MLCHSFQNERNISVELMQTRRCSTTFFARVMWYFQFEPRLAERDKLHIFTSVALLNRCDWVCEKGIFRGLTEQSNKPNNKESLIIFRHLLLFYYYFIFHRSFLRATLSLSSILSLFFSSLKATLSSKKIKMDVLTTILTFI